MLWRIFFKAFLIALCTLPAIAQTTTAANNAPAPAQTPVDPVDAKLQEALRERDAIIRNLLQRVQELEWRVNGGFTTRPVDYSTSGRAAADALTRAVTSPGTSVVTNAGYDLEERQASEALDRALQVRGGLLVPKGTLEIDNTTSYFSSSSDHLTVNGFALLPILVVGDITSQRLRKDVLMPTFTTRLGLPWRMQAEANVPYGYQLIRTVDANNKETSQSTFGMGDVSFGASRQLTFEKGKVPDLLANIRFKTTTGVDAFNLQSSQTALGTGFYSISGNLTAAKSSDPVVFFGSIAYTNNLAGRHTIPDPNNPGATMIGHFRPGGQIAFQLGSILAVNPETSFTLGWDQRFTSSTSLNGQTIPSSYLVEGTLRLGTTYVYAPGKMVDLSFGVGLTPDTPNLQFSVGFPLRYSLWRPKTKSF